ncbi:hypothetical protein E2320_008163, partial [Naja naja]
MCRAGRGPGGR